MEHKGIVQCQLHELCETFFCQEHENDHDQKNFNVHKAYMTNYNYISLNLNSTIHTRVIFQAKTHIIRKYPNIILFIIFLKMKHETR